MTISPVGAAAPSVGALGVAASPPAAARAAPFSPEGVTSAFRLLLASQPIEAARIAPPKVAPETAPRGPAVRPGASPPGLVEGDEAAALAPSFALPPDARPDAWHHKHSAVMTEVSPSAVPSSPFSATVAPSAPSVVARPPPSLEELFPALVRRVAWSGDRHRGSLRLEIGSGDLEGATLIVHAEERRVRVEMQLPPGADAEAWRSRLEQSLASRGVDAESVQVR